MYSKYEEFDLKMALWQIHYGDSKETIYMQTVSAPQKK